MLRRRIGVTVACCCLVVSASSGVALSPIASATTPGSNGKIAFDVWQNGFIEIFTVNPDGSALSKLARTRSPAGGSPSWSPDGSKIAYYWRSPSGAMDIFVMNADGSGKTQLTDLHSYAFDPTWSPNGSKIAFLGHNPTGWGQEIFTMKADGTDLTQLTDLHSPYTDMPEWSPDGSKIAFGSHFKSQLYVVNGDGSGLAQITTGNFDSWPDWSPAGTKIAFARTSRRGVKSIYTVDPDGSGLTRLTTGGTSWFPKWSPDGTKIVFQGERGGISVINADGSGLQVVPGTRNDRYPDWSPDGTMFVFTHFCPGNRSHSTIAVANTDGSKRVRLTTHSDSFDAYAPVWQSL